VSGRIITNPHGLQLHVGGRSRPKQTRDSHPHLFRSVRDFMKGAALPPAPDSFDYTVDSAAAQADILGNDTLGDCTAAGAAHIIEAVTSMAGAPVVLSRDQTVNFYSLTTGYNPSDPSTDQGGDEVTVCTYWQDPTKGFDGKGTHAIGGWAALTDEELADWAFVKSMAWLFPMYFGLELATPWTQIQGGGYTWDVGSPPNPSDGHCVAGLGGSDAGLKINSWGFLGTITPAAIAQFCASTNGGNLFAILTKEAINQASQKAPNAFDYAAMLTFLDQFGGNAPAVAPPPPPPPPPVPTGPATIDNVKAWGAAGINADPNNLMTKQQAIDAMNAGLDQYYPKSGS
jgi:hypothetical protein